MIKTITSKQIKMKYLAILLCSLLLSCSGNETKKENEKTPSLETVYEVDPASTYIKWTAYKTTDKIAVKGQFTKLELQKKISANEPLQALNGVSFNIPIDGIDTKDKGRDKKIIDYFFGTMTNTKSMTGTITVQNKDTGIINLSMNGISQDIPITLVSDGQLITMKGLINLNNWKAQAALAALNTVCKDLHTGPDGQSKTWGEVNIESSVYVKAVKK